MDERSELEAQSKAETRAPEVARDEFARMKN